MLGLELFDGSILADSGRNPCSSRTQLRRGVQMTHHKTKRDRDSQMMLLHQRLMRHSNIATTMNVYGKASLRAKQQADSKVVQMLIKQKAA